MAKAALSSLELKSDTVYTQWCTEFRRHRDYELTAAGWFSALQIGLATIMYHLPDSISNTLHDHATPKIAWTILVSLVGLSGVLAVSYTKERTSQLGSLMNAVWGTLPLPRSTVLNPYFFVIANLIAISVGNFLLGGFLLGIPTKPLWIIATLLLAFLSLSAAKGKRTMFRPDSKARGLLNPGPAILTSDGVSERVEIEWCEIATVDTLVNGAHDLSRNLTGRLRNEFKNHAAPKIALLETVDGERFDVRLWKARYFTSHLPVLMMTGSDEGRQTQSGDENDRDIPTVGRPAV